MSRKNIQREILGQNLLCYIPKSAGVLLDPMTGKLTTLDIRFRNGGSEAHLGIFLGQVCSMAGGSLDFYLYYTNTSFLNGQDHKVHNTQSTTVSVPSLELGPPTPSLASECASPGSPRNQRGGGGTHSPVCEGGWGVPIRTTGEKAYYSVYSVVRTLYVKIVRGTVATRNQGNKPIYLFIYRLLCCVYMIIMVDMKRVTKILQFSFVQHIYAKNTNVFHIDAELNRITERTVHSTVLHFNTLVFKQHLQYIQYIEMRINRLAPLRGSLFQYFTYIHYYRICSV